VFILSFVFVFASLDLSSIVLATAWRLVVFLVASFGAGRTLRSSQLKYPWVGIVACVIRFRRHHVGALSGTVGKRNYGPRKKAVYYTSSRVLVYNILFSNQSHPHTDFEVKQSLYRAELEYSALKKKAL
jgi:hypothetical protein